MNVREFLFENTDSSIDLDKKWLHRLKHENPRIPINPIRRRTEARRATKEWNQVKRNIEDLKLIIDLLRETPREIDEKHGIKRECLKM